MAPPSPSAFARRLRGCSAEDLAGLAGALWRARGRTVHVEGRVVEVADPGAGATYYGLASAAGIVGLLRTDRRRGVDGVVTGSPIAARLAAAALSATGTADPAVIDSDHLRELAWYAVDATARDAILATHLGDGDDPGTPPTGGSSVPPVRSRRAAVATAVTLAAAMVVIGGVLGGAGLPASRPAAGGEGTVTVTAVERPTATPTAVPTQAPAPTPSAVATTRCGPPPPDTPPASLRPRLGDADSSDWRAMNEVVVERFGPFHERTGSAPDERYIGTYTDTAGHHVRFEIDRWRTADRARIDGDRETDRSDVWMVWGFHTVSVRAYDANWSPLPDTTAVDIGHHLVTRMRRPSGERFPSECALLLLQTAGAPLGRDAFVGNIPGDARAFLRENATAGAPWTASEDASSG